MEKKNNYFKHLIKSMDVFVAVFVGFVLAACLWFVDFKDIFYTIKPSYATWLQAIYHGGVIAAVVGSLIALYPSLKEKTVVKSDVLLVVLTALSFLAAVLFGIIGSIVTCVLWAIAFIICVIYFASRMKEFDANGTSENVLDVKGYYATIARKYNFFLLVVIALVVSVIALVAVENGVLLTGMFKYYAAGFVAVALCGAVAQPLVKKDTKVGIIDALLVIAVLFSVFFSAFIIKSDFKLRYAFVYLIFLLGSAFALIFRSIFVSSNVKVAVAKKNLSNYHGQVFAKYGAFTPVVLGSIAGVCCSLVTRYGRISEAFRHVRPALFAIVAVLVTVGVLALIVYGIVKKGYKNPEANVLDFGLMAAFVGAVAGLGMVYCAFSYKRVILIAIPLVFSVVSMFIRSRKVEVISQEVVEKNDDIVVDVKIVVDGDDIKAYCEGAEVEVTIVNKTPVEAAPVEEAAPAVEEKEEAPVEEAPVAEAEVEAEDKLIIAKRSFENKIKFASPKAKNYYSDLKNAIMVYKTKARVSKKAEAFRKNGLFAKLSVSGKSIRVHLALDPLAYDVNKYHHVDLGSKRAFKEVPFTMKIRSDLACKRAIELIDELAAARGLKMNKKYVPVNYAEGLDIDGAAILEKLGLYDQLSDVATKQQAENLTDEVLNFIPTVTLAKPLNEESVNVYLDTELKYVENTISAETLHEAQRIPATVDTIVVKARTGLDKRITVVADEIDPLAAKLVILTGGKVFKVVRK